MTTRSCEIGVPLTAIRSFTFYLYLFYFNIGYTDAAPDVLRCSAYSYTRSGWTVKAHAQSTLAAQDLYLFNHFERIAARSNDSLCVADCRAPFLCPVYRIRRPVICRVPAAQWSIVYSQTCCIVAPLGSPGGGGSVDGRRLGNLRGNARRLTQTAGLL